MNWEYRISVKYLCEKERRVFKYYKTLGRLICLRRSTDIHAGEERSETKVQTLSTET